MSDDLDARIAAAAILCEARGNMARSHDRALRRFDHRAALARIDARPKASLPALPAPVWAPRETVTIDLTAVQPLTAEELSVATGVSLRQIAKAIASKKIRTSKSKGEPRRLDVADCAGFLHDEHGISPAVLLDVYRETDHAE